MPSKYCPNCQKIISTGGMAPKYCFYCGYDFKNMPVLPEFKSYEERLNALEQLKKEYQTKPKQLSLF